MSVTVAASWSHGHATVTGFFFPPPAASPVQVPVANTAGDWMAVLVTWRQLPAGAAMSVSVADDAHNWWEPLGAPSGDSSAAGVTRTAIWVAPAARAAANVQVAPTGPYLSLAVYVLDIAGMLPWMTLTAITPASANAATSLTAAIGAPSAQMIALAALGTDNLADTISGPGAGWTALTPVTASNGTDHTGDIQLNAAWQVTAGAASAAWSSTGALDMSAVTAGLLVSGTAPSQPYANWPVVVTEIAPGAGAQTPPSQVSWTPLSARALSLQFQQGRQYTLSQLQAGQGTMTIDNPDGALIPPGTGSFAGIDSGTPVRQRVIIPSLPSPHYVPYSGFFKRWPFAAEADLLRGKTTAEITDTWGYANGILNAMAVEESLIDSPYALWPLNDPAGSSAGSNLAPGNANPLNLVQSKYGSGGATATWGQNSSALVGLTSSKSGASSISGTSGSGMIEQVLAGTSLAFNGYGYALNCTDTNYPPITGGVTVECWFQCNLATLINGIDGSGVFAATASQSPAFKTSGASFPNGMPLIPTSVSGFTFPSPFVSGTVYYVTNSDGQGNYDLSATQGGSAIACTVSGSGRLVSQLAWNPVVATARNVAGRVIEIAVRNTDGALLMLYRTASGSQNTVVLSTSQDYRNMGGIVHLSVSFTTTAYRVLLDGGGIATVTGSFASALPASFTELDFGGIQDRAVQGYAMPGYIAAAGVYPLQLAQARVISHYWGAILGMELDPACDRIERICEYAGLTGRRWLGQQVVTYEGDLTVSGQDIGGQAAASSASNIAASTLPAMLYVAPTGDIVYAAKFYQWNQPVRWVLGDNVPVPSSSSFLLAEDGTFLLAEDASFLLAESSGSGGFSGGGEIPFLLRQFATDYDPSRVIAGVQLTQLDTQTVTVAAGTTATETMTQVTAAAQRQYGAQPYQQTGYLNYDWSAAYTAGGSLTDLADWLQNVYAKPANRVQAVTVEAFANTANSVSQLAWQFWAGASVGDMVTVNLRLPTAATSPLISLTARITQTQRSMQFSQDGTSAQITCTLDFAPEYNALICDDPVRGLLNGTNVLAWL